MNREVSYIWQGFLLMLVVLAGMGLVQSITSARLVEPVLLACGNIDERPVVINSVGAKLFRDNCATCHRLNKDLTGPALAGIENRVKDKKLLYTWIRNNAVVLKSGNRYFTDLYNRFNQTPMNAFPYLSDSEIADILTYIRQEEVAAP